MPESLESQHRDIERMTSLGLLAKNAAANLIQPGIGWLVLLVLSPILVRVLDTATYGTWMLLLQIGAYFTVVDGTIQLTITHFVSRARGTGDREYMRRMLTTAEVVLLVMGALAAVTSWLVAWRLGFVFKDIPRTILSDASAALIFIGCAIGSALPFSTLAGSFRAYQKNELSAIATVTGKVVGALGIGWAAFHHEGLARMAVWWAIGNLISPALLLIFWSRWRDRVTIRLSNVSPRAIREFLGFGGSLIIAQLCGLLITGLDMPVVAAFAFPAAAYYALASTVTSMVTVPQIAITSVVFPVTSAMSGLASPARMGSALIKFSRYSTAIQLLLTLPLVAGMSILLRLWVGPVYAKYSLPLAMVLVVSQFVRTTLRPFAMVSLSAGQQTKILLSPISEGAVNLSVSLVLVHWMGAIGVAIGTLVGAFVGVAVHLTVSIKLIDHAVHVDRGRLLAEGILRPMLCAAPASILLAWMYVENISTPFYVIGIATGMAITALLLYVWNFKAEERTDLHRLARRCMGLSAVAGAQ